ncbi:MAG: site-specific integrase [Opitutaceae bacterium]
MKIEGGPSGPLSPYIGQYIDLIRAQGYVSRSIRYHLSLLIYFDGWLTRTRHGLREVDERLIAKFLDRRVRAEWVHVSAPATMRRLLAMLRGLGAVPPAATVVLTPARQLTKNYERFLVEERALSLQTVAAWTPFVGRFLSGKFGDGPLSLPGLKASDVTVFIQRHARRHGSSYARKLVASMRSFLRYLHYKGLNNDDLARAVPKVARWSLSTLPKHLLAAQVKRVLDCCERRTALGRRNYAILLLLARLGLRAGEIIGLTLDDLDWENCRITVRGKGGRSAQLPLPADVSRAIARYLRQDRPRCDSRSVFIRDYAPIGGLTRATSIAKIVLCGLRNAGVVSARKGAHLLRHSLATDMLRRGASLDEIGEILRHKSPDTTAIYAKVDVGALRSLALAWPGGAL